MTYRTLTIGELALQVKGADLAAQLVDTCIASDFEVEVTYKYQPSDLEAGILEHVVVKEVIAPANVHFSGDLSDVLVRRGSDLLPLFSGAQVTAMEDMLLQAIREKQ